MSARRPPLVAVPARSALTAGLAALVVVGGLAAATEASASTPGRLAVGDRLASGASLASPQGRYRLVMQTDGNLVERRASGGAAIWTSGTRGHGGAGLVVQGDGNVVVYPTSGAAVWSTRTKAANVSFSVQDDGNMVVRSAAGAAIWASGPDRPAPLVPPGDVLHIGHAWSSSHEIYYSPSHEFELSVYAGMLSLGQRPPGGGGTSVWAAGALADLTTPTLLTLQGDGNLVLTSAGRVAWQSATSHSAASYFVVQDDGNLVIRAADGRAVWSSGSTRAILAPGKTLASGARLRALNRVGLPWGDLTMQTDGNLVLRYGSAVVWSSNTHVAGARLVMQTDGNVVILAPSGVPVWSTGTVGHPGASLVVGGVRDLQVHGPGGTIWERP